MPHGAVTKRNTDTHSRNIDPTDLAGALATMALQGPTDLDRTDS